MASLRNRSWEKKLLQGLFSTVGSLPLWFLYGLSDFIALFVGDIIGYRKSVIHTNLSSCLPDKDKKELREIEKGYYRFLCDYFVETLRLGCMGKEEIMHRMKFEGTDLVNEALSQGKNVTLYLGHYCNWEWLSSIPLHIREKVFMCQIYHPLENEASDAAFLKIRGRFGANSVKMADTLKVLRKYHQKGVPTMTGYIADQSPLFNAMRYFTNFLHHDTPVTTGPERLSRMFHATVFYCDIERPKRGEYICRFIKMTDDASTLPPFELTEKYFRMLETSILHKPDYWLWSHRRWKRTRQDFYDYFGEKEALKRLSNP